MSLRTASALRRGIFLIDPSFVHSNLNLVVDMFSGKAVDFGFNERQEESLLKDLPVTPFTTLHASLQAAQQTFTPAHNLAYSAAAGTQVYNVGLYTRFDDVPAGSIAVVNLLGPVLKYGDICSYGMVDKATLLTRIAASGKFKSVILNVDSPGGQADGTQLLADTIKGLPIPVIAVVDDGMMASAAMWIGSACAEIYATKLTDTFGSIGVFTSLYDFREFLEKAGVEIKDFYADESFDKNKTYKDALDDKPQGLIDNLNFLAKTFHAAIIANRGDKLVLTEAKSEDGKVTGQEPLTGKMYPAAQALEIGLIDGIKSFEDILLRADQIGDDPLQAINPNQNTMFGNKFKSLTALKGKKADEVTQSSVDAVNQEIEAEGIGHVSLALDSDLSAASAASTENGTVLASINKILGAGNEKTTLTEAFTAMAAAAANTATSLTQMTADRDSWKAKAAEYGAKDADKPTDTNQVGDDKIENTGGAQDAYYSEADASLAKLRADAGLPAKPAAK